MLSLRHLGCVYYAVVLSFFVMAYPFYCPNNHRRPHRFDNVFVIFKTMI